MLVLFGSGFLTDTDREGFAVYVTLAGRQAVCDYYLHLCINSWCHFIAPPLQSFGLINAGSPDAPASPSYEKLTGFWRLVYRQAPELVVAEA